MVLENTQAIGNRYLLHEPLGQGAMGIVYRATDRLQGTTVALKQISILSQELQSSPKTGTKGESLRLALIAEFRILAALRHPHIISVLDFGFDQQQPYFTMEYLPHAQNILATGAGRSSQEKVELLVQMLQALAYLHRCGILHRDLKPDNVLVMNGHTRLLDFGLSVTRDNARGRAGTLAYMAPEVLRSGHMVEASDLYAVGVLAYELFAGHRPFEADDILGIVTRPPDLSTLAVGPALTQVIARLLRKEPAERYADAQSAIAGLREAAGLPSADENVAIRESFLQAAKFVGREAELTQLEEALAAAASGQGSAWLIAGESGVGKSRLVDELRTLALVRGALVAVGQAISEGGARYQLWRGPLRRLALEADPRDEEASLLKLVVPEIEELLDREIPDPPGYEPKVAQALLIQVVGEMLKRQEQPLVLLLEDLQWAGSENLTILRRLIPHMDGMPVLVLATYRDDEKPTPFEGLPGVNVLKLERLSETGTAELSASMLGEAGRRQEVVAFLQQETEGNPFFLVEVVRVLAEEAGHLQEIGSRPLPERVLPGGVQAVVQRRLARLPADALPLLRLAAVAGRELDLRLLAALTERDLEGWLAVCAGAAVLEAQGTRWRFAHDKLREDLLAKLSRKRFPRLHRQVAETIQALYPNDPDQYARLAYLWEKAGDREKAVDFRVRAGERARRSYANTEAIDHFERALALLTTSGQLNQTYWTWRLRALAGLGKVYYEMGQLHQGEKALRETIVLAKQQGLARNDLIQLFHWLGETLFWLGKHEDRLHLGQEGLALLGDEVESLEAALMNQLTAYGYFFAQDDPNKWRELTFRTARFLRNLPYVEELRPAYIHIVMVYRYERNVEAVLRWIQYLEIEASQHHDLVALAEALYYYGGTYYRTGDFTQAWAWYQQALTLARRLGDAKRETWVLQGMGGISLYVDGDLEKAETEILRLLEIADDLGFKEENVVEEYFELGTVYLCQGNWRAATATFQKAIRLSQECDYRFHRLWGTYLLGRAALAQGSREQALRCFGQALTLARPEDFQGESGLKMSMILAAIEEAHQDVQTLRLSRPYHGKHPHSGMPSLEQFSAPPGPKKSILPCNRTLSISAGQGWHWEDPFGDSGQYETEDGLTIQAANGRDLWRLNLSAPRFLQEATGDLVAQTACRPVAREKPAIGGLLLWRDRENFLWLARGRAGAGEVLFGGCVANQDLVVGRTLLSLPVSQKIFLRLERRAGQVAAFCSADGETWFAVGCTPFPMADPVQIGLHAIGHIPRHIYHGAYPDGTAIHFGSFWCADRTRREAQRGLNRRHREGSDR